MDTWWHFKYISFITTQVSIVNPHLCVLSCLCLSLKSNHFSELLITGLFHLFLNITWIESYHSTVWLNFINTVAVSCPSALACSDSSLILLTFVFCMILSHLSIYLSDICFDLQIFSQLIFLNHTLRNYKLLPCQ